jgi:hypothetical protein
MPRWGNAAAGTNAVPPTIGISLNIDQNPSPNVNDYFAIDISESRHMDMSKSYGSM